MSDTYGFADTRPMPEPQQQKPDLVGQWTNWMQDPANRAVLLQTGIQLMQPIGLGQTTAGHVGQAIGAGGEAASRITEEERAAAEQARKQQETESRSTLREARATAAEARAARAGAGLDVRSQQLGLAQQRLGLQQDINRRNAIVRAQATYEQAKRNNANERLVNPQVPPLPTFAEWLRQSGAAELLGVGGAGASGAAGYSPADGGPEAPVPSTAAPAASGGQWMKVSPSALSRYPDAKQAPDGNWYVQR